MLAIFSQNFLFSYFCFVISMGYGDAGGANGRDGYDNSVLSVSELSNKTIHTTSAVDDTWTAKKTKKKKKRHRRRGCVRTATASYNKMKRRWQTVPKIKAPKWRDGYRDLVLYSVNLGLRARVFPFLEDGTLDPEAMTEIEKVCADKDTKAEHSVHPRLVKLLYKLAVHFDAKQINVISGYREESVGSESHHANGSAIDIMVPGVKLPALARFARRLGHVGVGYYPVSGFIHLDVRAKSSYFWADPSGPGKRSCMRQIMANHGRKFDRRWKSSHDEPEQKKDKKGNIKGARPSGDDAKNKKTPQK